MRVILTQKVPHVGNVGEIVKVSPGFGRNFLLPQKLAVVADEGSKREFENNKRRLQKKIDAEKNTAQALKDKIEGFQVELIKRVGNNGKLFGAVTNVELAAYLKEHRGVEVERRLIVLAAPIKTTGTFNVTVKLFQGVTATFSVKVIMDPVQAEELKKQQAASEKRAQERKLAAQNAPANEAQAQEGEASEEEDQDSTEE